MIIIRVLFDKPLATLVAARNKARDYRKNNLVSQPVEIVALEGEYSMLQPLEITTEDSGTPTAPLVIRADEGAKVSFSSRH